jgi:NAD-dependent DNA ligase
MSKLITKDFIKDPYNYATKLKIKDLEKVLRKLSDEYYNSQNNIVSDEIFDLLKDLLKEKDPENKFLKEIGASISKEKVKLPFTMFSLDKIKPDTNALELWNKKYKGPYIVTDKLDGVSGLLVYSNNTIKLYTRGDGRYGQDISFLIPYLLPKSLQELKFKETFVFRGEIIISKSNFESLSKIYKNTRNTVSGLVNSKKLKIDIAKITDFVVYSIVEPRFSYEKQIKKIKKYKFNIVSNNTFTSLTNDQLSKLLIKRRKDSEYDIDGLVVCDSSKTYERVNKNPSESFAFKTILSDQIAEVIVKNVKWNISMDKYFKPVVEIQPVKLNSVTISNVTAHNAKFIYDNKIGPGSVLKIIRSGDVIPKIQEVIKSSSNNKPQMPDEDYEWNETNVDIISVNDTMYSDIKNIVYFFSKIGAKYISEGIISNLYKNGYTDIFKIIKSDENKLAKIDGIGEKLVKKIKLSINKSLQNITLETLMASSRQFKRGFGVRKLKLVIDQYPNIIDKKWSNEKMIDKIKLIDGFDVKTATQFTENFKDFLKFYKKISKYIKLKENVIKNSNEDQIFKNINVVFTGFRDKIIEEFIITNGGNVRTSVSSKTNLVIFTDINSSKVIKAQDNNIETILKNDFIKKYNL